MGHITFTQGASMQCVRISGIAEVSCAPLNLLGARQCRHSDAASPSQLFIDDLEVEHAADCKAEKRVARHALLNPNLMIKHEQSCETPHHLGRERAK